MAAYQRAARTAPPQPAQCPAQGLVLAEVPTSVLTVAGLPQYRAVLRGGRRRGRRAL